MQQEKQFIENAKAKYQGRYTLEVFIKQWYREKKGHRWSRPSLPRSKREHTFVAWDGVDWSEPVWKEFRIQQVARKDREPMFCRKEGGTGFSLVRSNNNKSVL